MPHKRALPVKPTAPGDQPVRPAKGDAASGDDGPAADPAAEDRVPAYDSAAQAATAETVIASEMPLSAPQSALCDSQGQGQAASLHPPGSDGHGRPEAVSTPAAIPPVAAAPAEGPAAMAADAEGPSAPAAESASSGPADPPAEASAPADDPALETLEEAIDQADLLDEPPDRPAAGAAGFPPGWEDELPVIRIRPTGGWRSLDLREVWRYRELMLTLAWREISIRYKQTALGAAWAIIQPLMTTGIFSVLFALLMGRGNEPTPQGIPYVVSTFCAMLPWQLFAHSLNQSGNILVQYRAMITKIYFPRLILPAAAVLSTLMDFAVAFVALLAVMLLYGVVPGWAVVLLPLFVVLAVVSSLAVGLWLAAMNAIYRDFRYVIPFIVQIGMFISPVVYSTDSIRHRLPDWAMTLYLLNPMAGVIEGFRWALLGTARAPGVELALSAAAATVILVAGMFYFRRMERTIADLI